MIDRMMRMLSSSGISNLVESTKMDVYLFTILWSVLTSIFSIDAVEVRFNSPTNIEYLEVKCNESEPGLFVQMKFNHSFNGTIYSQGFSMDSNCRYVLAGENIEKYSFVVPLNGCGTRASCATCNSIDNILIIQHNEEFQSEYDIARKISCTRSDEDERQIFFQPIKVDRLDVVTVPTTRGGIECWMDIQRGVFPNLTPLDGVIKIGDNLTVSINLRNHMNEYDLFVRNCWAYDKENFEHNKTGKIQLSDGSGCSIKKNLFGYWHKSANNESSEALQVYNSLKAFKFSDESEVFFKCDIDICRGACPESMCDGEDIDIINQNPHSLHSSVTEITTPMYTQNTFKTTTMKRGYDLFCNLYPKHKRCYQFSEPDRNSNSDKAFEPLSSFPTMKYTQSTAENVKESIACTSNPTNGRCRNSKIIATTETSTSTPYTLLPSTFESTTQKASTSYKKEFLICVPGSNDNQCDIKSIENIKGQKKSEPTSNISPTTEKPICFRGTHNSECLNISSDILSFKQKISTDLYGQSNREKTTVPQKKTTASTDTTNDIRSTSIITKCSQGNSDQRCLNGITLTTPPSIRTTEIPIKMSVIENIDSETESSTDEIENPTMKLMEKIVKSINITYRCYPGALDPRCSQSTTMKSTKNNDISTEKTIDEVFSTPSGSYPTTEMPKLLEQIKYESSTKQMISSPQSITSSSLTTPTFCFPGSKDKRCPQLSASFNTISPYTYLPPLPREKRIY